MQPMQGCIGCCISFSAFQQFGVVVDVGYVGSIVVKLSNHSDVDYQVKAGDKISQLVILPILTPTLDLVDTLEDTDRGDNGFGSSGR